MKNSRLSIRAQACRQGVRWMLAPIFRAQRAVAARRRALLRVAALTRLPMVPRTRFSADTLRGVPVEWAASTHHPAQRVLLYFHGGAYVVGAPSAYRGLTARLAQWAQARVAAVDYRLAPEHPFPAAPDDALDAYRGLLERGIAASDIVIAGDSAGGGLSLACVLKIRDAGLPMPAGLALLSPWTDLTLGGESMRSNADREILLDPAMLEASAGDYLGTQDRAQPLASPLFADLRGLPPTLVQVADTEILYDDARRLVERIEAAGGTAELSVARNLWHVWQIFAGKMPEADAALHEIARFIVRHAHAG
jgi:acetyl esterase/lipase